MPIDERWSRLGPASNYVNLEGIELKIVGINPNNAKKRLAAINARFKGSYVLQRVTFQGTRSGRIKDYKSNTANDSYYTSWIRVRTDVKCKSDSRYSADSGKRAEERHT